MASDVLSTCAACVLLGVTGQVFASLTRMPAIVFLLALGIAAGPQGANVVRPKTLGEGLAVLTALFVAVILFEGGLSLRPNILRNALSPVRRLITVGALVTFVGAGLVGHWAADLPWPQAFLFGSLVIVTGPTVVTPILRRVRLHPRLHAVLKSEGILIDAIGAITAIVALEYAVAAETLGMQPIVGFLSRLGVGLLTGAIAGFGAALLLQLPLFHKHDNEHLVHLGALGLALSAFAVSERLLSESGILAATVAGLVLAATSVPFRDQLERFKEHLTILGVSILFVLLSANIDINVVASAGWPGVVVVAALILVVRPASVWLSTWGTYLDWREKTYISLLAPRGIVAAAMASHFSAKLSIHGVVGAERIESLVFLTIAVTVLLQGGWAAPLARLLGVVATHPTGVLIIGVNTWSLVVAEELRKRGVLVHFLDLNPVHCERAREQGFEVTQDDASEDETYEGIDLSNIGTAIAMTSNDAVNTLACDAACEWLGGDHVYQVLSKPLAGEQRARVRFSGRWAMPSKSAHQSICALLRRGEATVVGIDCPERRSISNEMVTPSGALIPLLVVQGQGVRIAHEGGDCPPGSTLLGLATAAET